ncbi:MAG: ATP-binding protein [Bacteroidales bacterium]|nr:ATP-binding protein [Bacteroidales bacterium]
MFKRKKYYEIKPWLNTHDIIVIHGSRQTGKTTLLKLFMQDIPENNFEYLDLEDSRLLEICEQGYENIINYLLQKGSLKQQKRFYLLIDEIQYLKNPSSLLKLLHDHHPEIKLIVTGSSSFEIKSKFKDSLVGRTINFELYPLDFEEFLIFKKRKYDLRKPISSKLIIEDLIKLYKEYIIFGGYPKIVLTETILMKEKYLQQIIDTYIKSDIRDLAKIRHIDKFNKLLRVLANQSGELLNINELSNTARIAKQTVEQYLFILENTYIIQLVKPFSKNVRSELFKTPKIFFVDTGILNMLNLKYLPKEISGNAFETSVFSEFLKNTEKDSINFWRTQDKKEIDFVILQKDTISLFEVKINALKFKKTPMKYFASKYNPLNMNCISLTGKLSENNLSIGNIKPWDLYTECF